MRVRLPLLLSILLIHLAAGPSHAQSAALDEKTCQPADLKLATLPPGKVFKTSFNPWLDAMINQEANMVWQVFGVVPNLFLLDDTGCPNAYATREVTHPLANAGTIYYGRQLLLSELNDPRRGGDAASGIMAHEFGHIVQFSRNTQFPKGTLHQELHADFLAGYYLGRKRLVMYTDPMRLAESLRPKADREFWEARHHGSPEHRVAALMDGYNHAWRLPPGVAYHFGYDRTERLVPAIYDHDEEVGVISTEESDSQAVSALRIRAPGGRPIHWDTTEQEPFANYNYALTNMSDKVIIANLVLEMRVVERNAPIATTRELARFGRHTHAFRIAPGQTRRFRGRMHWFATQEGMPRLDREVFAVFKVPDDTQGEGEPEREEP